MAQEFIIKSEDIENKINQLLPSQGGFQAGVDFSASTMVIPIVDLTETAEGSALRLDLQKATDFATTATLASDNTQTAANTPGFYKVVGSGQYRNGTNITVFINDGSSTKIIREFDGTTSTDQVFSFDDIVFLRAGDSLQATTTSTDAYIYLFTRQIADLQGNLVNPLGFGI